MKTFLCSVLLFCLFCGVIAHGNWNMETDVTVEHKFGAAGTWNMRGSIYYRSLANTPLSASSRTLEDADIIQKPLSEEDKQQLKNLVLKDDSYSIRLNNLDTGKYVMASVKGCALFESKLEDHIVLHFDQFGEVIGIEYSTQTSKCTLLPQLGISDQQIKMINEFNTTSQVKFAMEGGLPKRVTEAMNEQKKEKTEAPKQEQGFFAKYWMYLLIGLLVINIVPKLLGIEENQTAAATPQRPGRRRVQ